MMYLVVLSILITIAFAVKRVIEASSLLLLIKKNSEVMTKPNKFKEKFQFIKGLY